MKSFLIIIITAYALVAMSCSSTRSFSSTVEDDIYYVPGQKALVIQEVEKITGHPVSEISKEVASRQENSSMAQGSPVVNSRNSKLENVSISELSARAQEEFAANDQINQTIYENTGYWIGGYKGNNSDLAEIQRIINMYPEGFGYITNGQDIAFNLSFDPDWNVYTDNGCYWWFPSYSNINYYSALIFGDYPKYIWTVAWNSPRYDSWAFNNSFNAGISLNWGRPGWSIGFGSGFYNPWYNGWNGGFYDPWFGPNWYPGWGYNPHWHNHGWHDHWGNGHYPNWGPPSGPRPNPGNRPNYGGGVSGIRPGNRPGNRPENVVRPGTSQRPGSVSRPNESRPSGTVNRPNVSRPSGSVNRPNSPVITRPNSGGVIRPSNTTRPGNSNVTRPNSTTTRPNTTTRPGTITQPNSTTRPGTNQTRPANRPSSYSRPQNSYRPSYNSNSTSRYNSGSPAGVGNTRTSGSYSGSSSSGTRNQGSYTPSNSGGSNRPSSPVPSRPRR